jgi:hypothetical protein
MIYSSAIPTDPQLLEALRAAAARPLSRAERRAQRISFIYSCLDASSGVSKGQIAQALDAAQGLCTAPALGVPDARIPRATNGLAG